MKKKFLTFSCLLLSAALVLLFWHLTTKASFNANNVMDDGVFDRYYVMSAGQIDTWLNNNFPSSCISTNHGFMAPDPAGYNPTQGYSYGGAVSAGQVIYDAAQAYEINPQVLLTTLQKEEALVSGDAGCSSWRYVSAMGYGCPDSGGSYNYSNLSPPLYYLNGNAVTSISGTCVNSASKAGFSQQVIHAAWLLKFGEQRSEGNTGWAIIKGNWNNSDDPGTCYGGPMTQGYRKRCSSDSTTVYYDGYITIDGSSTHMDTGATAALYWYTPHFHGNQVFYDTFTSWFDPSTFIRDSLTMQNISQPNLSPAIGETLSYTVSFKNTLPVSLTVDAVGIVGRAGNLNGPNRDFGWQGPVTFQSGETKQFTFTTLAQETGSLYVWPAVYYQGNYSHYNNWGALLNVRVPNFSLTSALASSNPNPVASQTGTLSATLKNNESHAIKLNTVGIPVRFYGTYSYDTAWSVSPSTIQPGATQALSGNVVFDKPGPYTAWVSALIGNQYVTLSPNLNITASKPAPNFQLTYLETPNTAPALGEDVAVKFKLKNNSGVAMTLDAVGVVGRYDNPYTGANRDFGWVGAQSFTVGEEKSYTTFVSSISELRNLYTWVAINYQGTYVHYNNWGFMLSPHLPNLSLTVPVTVNSGTQPNLGQTVSVNATIKNNEPHPIRFSALGIPARYYGTYNYDAVWQGAGTLAASGQSGDSIALAGAITFDKSGPYTLWASILIQGRYITIGSVKNINI